jgi:hypothetical protein
MLKVFRLDKDDETIFQLQLVEREISTLLDKRNMQIQRNQERVEVTLNDHSHQDDTFVNKRTIEKGDVCPICQDLHSKCLKVLLDHHIKTMGQDAIKCPLCRTAGFGTVEEISAQLTDIETLKKEQKQKERNRHFGTTCGGCKKSPITGDVFRCLVCTVYQSNCLII